MDNIPHNGSDEFPLTTQWLLHLLSRRYGGEVPAPRIDPVPQEFIQNANYHRMTTVVAEPLLKNPPEWAGERLQNQIRVIQKRNNLRALAILASLIELKTQLAERSIPFINLKGLTLSQKLYGDIHTRSPGDIDFWIPETRVKEVVELFVEQGYESKTGFESLHPSYQRKFMRLTNHIGFMKGNVSLELHWRATEDPYLFPLEFEQVYSSSETIQLQGHDFQIMGKDHLLPYLIIHGASHIWERLHWLGDIASLTQELPPSKLPLEWAKRHALETPIQGGLFLASELLGSPRELASVHPKTFSKATKRHTDLSLGQLRKPHLQGRRLEAKDHFINMASLHPGRTRSLSFLLREIYCVSEWKNLKLPPYLSFLYLLWRPFSLIQKKLG